MSKLLSSDCQLAREEGRATRIPNGYSWRGADGRVITETLALVGTGMRKTPYNRHPDAVRAELSR